MLCKLCNNLLNEVSTPDGLRLYCEKCNTTYTANPDDTCVYSSNESVVTMVDKGTTIWWYPANQKIKINCVSEKCKYRVVAFQKNLHNVKIYGCRCGTTWMHV